MVTFCAETDTRKENPNRIIICKQRLKGKVISLSNWNAKIVNKYQIGTECVANVIISVRKSQSKAKISMSNNSYNRYFVPHKNYKNIDFALLWRNPP